MTIPQRDCLRLFPLAADHAVDVWRGRFDVMDEFIRAQCDRLILAFLSLACGIVLDNVGNPAGICDHAFCMFDRVDKLEVGHGFCQNEAIEFS